MDDFAKWSKEVIHFTLPGSVYLISAFLFYQVFSDNSLNVKVDFIFNNTLLIFIILVFISFILGLSIHYSFQRVLWLLYPKYFEQFINDIKDAKDIDLLSIRRPMIMYRHLFISFVFLSISTLMFLKKNNHGNLLLSFFVFLLCLLIFTLAYSYLRKALIESEKVNKRKIK